MGHKTTYDVEQAGINPAKAPRQVDASVPGHGGPDGASHGTTNCTLSSSEDMENSSGRRSAAALAGTVEDGRRRMAGG
jgi:hypothetical protein